MEILNWRWIELPQCTVDEKKKENRFRDESSMIIIRGDNAAGSWRTSFQPDSGILLQQVDAGG